MGCFLTLWLSGALAAAAVSVVDFGYQNKTVPTNQPLLVVLAHFTDATFDGTTNDWDNHFFAGTANTNTMNGFFGEVSSGRFSFTRGGTIRVSLPGSERNTNLLALAGGNQQTADILYTSNIVYHAMQAPGFRFADYDRDANTVITGSELAIAVVNNDKFVAYRDSGDVKPAGSSVTYNARVAFQVASFSESAFEGACHEVGHRLGAKDLYGAWSSEALLNQALSIMSSHNGACHLDPWHKMQFGWSAPRLQRLSAGGLIDLPAASSGGTNAPVLLHDPAHGTGTNEYFLIEYRTRTNSTKAFHYDRHVSGNGMVLWHVYQTNYWPVQHADLVYPEVETGWRECVWCRSLVHVSATNLPCASPDSTNQWHLPRDSDHRLMASTNASYGGQIGWTRCGKCGGLYYFPNRLQSVCPKDRGIHLMLAGTGDHQIRRDVPDLVGHTYWHHCTNCQMLFLETQTKDLGYSDCPKAGQTNHLGSTNRYVVILRDSHLTMMAEGPPDLLPGASAVWTNGVTTPRLRWYDGTVTPYFIRVLPFTNGAPSITVELFNESDTWVDFAYGGAENGTFSQPYNTFNEGVDAVGHGGNLRIKAGQSAESRRVTKRVRIQSYGGSATIGR